MHKPDSIDFLPLYRESNPVFYQLSKQNNKQQQLLPSFRKRTCSFCSCDHYSTPFVRPTCICSAPTIYNTILKHISSSAHQPSQYGFFSTRLFYSLPFEKPFFVLLPLLSFHNFFTQKNTNREAEEEANIFFVWKEEKTEKDFILKEPSGGITRREGQGEERKEEEKNRSRKSLEYPHSPEQFI